jgi:Putative amidoligase enzyme.
MAKNAKLLNDMFGRRAVTVADPDQSWPLASELVGIEIEVEDLAGDPTAVFPEWTIHPDQSLRNGTEFVTSGPVGGTALTNAINKFFNAKFHYNMSPRTSVHIHVNASDNMNVDQFRNLFVVMYLFEPAVFRWADENRKWCGYCSPLTDIDPNRIVTILNENNNDARLIQAIRGANNQDRYYGFNVAAYHKHGTVEFRYFPCTDDKQELVNWIKFVMHVKETARAYEGPASLLATLITREDVRAFIKKRFPETSDALINNLDFDDCLGRVRELIGMLGVLPEDVREGEKYRTHRSKGLTKFLASTFPKAVDNFDPLADVQDRNYGYQEFARLVRDGAPASKALKALNAQAEEAIVRYPPLFEAPAAHNAKLEALHRAYKAKAARR